MNSPFGPKISRDLYAEKLKGAAADRAMRGAGNTRLIVRVLPLVVVVAVLGAVVFACVMSTR